ncbi:MAG: dihydroorotase [Candidatus Cloacimonetes bacterium]|jgi:dihydroorotase|nr:dihydroorotase [Candidatus Cloacimonadota bacterium]MDY0337974.1 dihydroorotase [Candidatus Cloacimonadaceae bacterium]MDD2544034.1 dihydroorotase [Candidatus Cloacimonadota bacterium]MDD3096957.1 dihydroorotase [Candidatus Cloacimonadota bacterium]MDD3578882.1 dihydroorotase [Candidatus Cloacimonadota bacterium]
MKILIKNAEVYTKGKLQKQDILLDRKRIAKIANKLDDKADKVIDAKGCCVFPGFIDLHSHLRDPGQTYKEDIVSGTKAAAKGGFTAVCAMPNTDPVTDNIASVEYIQLRAKEHGSARVYVVGALTKQSMGEEISEMATMKSGGIIAVSDDGKCVQNARLMLSCLRYAANFKIPVIVHPEDYALAGKGQIHGGKVATKTGLSGISGLAEEVIVARDIMLAESAGATLHIAHISTEKSLELVRAAKAKGLPVTCEVTPHHLVLNEEACLTFDTNTKMKPPLRSESDRLACIQALKEGLIDCIATDHAPHADFEKEREFDHAPFGIIGFETAFAVLYRDLVLTGMIDLNTLVDSLSIRPAKVLNLPGGEITVGANADLCIFDLKQSTLFSKENILSKSKNSPWLNQEMPSRLRYTIVGGNISYQDE